MQARNFISSYVYPVLTQRWASLMYSEQALLDFINLALNDIYSFEWKTWSFMYTMEENIYKPWTPTNESYPKSTNVMAGTSETHTVITDYPIIRIQYFQDTRTLSTNTELKNTPINWTDGEYFFIPHTNNLTVYDNNSTEWYKFWYVHSFNRLISLDQEIPLPDLFFSALMLITMWYVYPWYGQFWEGKDVQVDQKWYMRLKDLAKVDSFQVQYLTSSIH